MIWLRIVSESILSLFCWHAKLRFLLGFSKSQEGLSGRCGLRKMQTITRPGLRSSVVTIRQVWGMSWWQLPTFIIYVGLVNNVFGGWLGGCQNFIFINTIKTFWCNNMPGSGQESVENSYLFHLCRILKAWRFGLGNVQLLATSYLDHMGWVSNLWCLGLVNAVFEGWLGDYQKFILSNTVETSCCKFFQGRRMSWWKWSNLVSHAGFRKLDGSDL